MLYKSPFYFSTNLSRPIALLSIRQRGGKSEEGSSATEADCRGEAQQRIGAAAAGGDDRASQGPAAGDEGQDVDGGKVREESV